MRQGRPKTEILYEDAEVIVCVKPAGLAVQTAKAGQADMVSELKNYRAKKKEEPYIGLVHRLDQPVRGVMVFAKTPGAAATLSRQISEGAMDKEYFAVLTRGTDAKDLGERGQLTDYLLKDGKSNTSSVVQKGTKGAKEARLSYEIVEKSEDGGRCLAHICLDTGRHHQIRVQFSHAGWPLWGDQKYGAVPRDGTYFPIALCSCRLSFSHPKTGESMVYTISEEYLKACLA